MAQRSRDGGDKIKRQNWDETLVFENPLSVLLTVFCDAPKDDMIGFNNLSAFCVLLNQCMKNWRYAFENLMSHFWKADWNVKAISNYIEWGLCCSIIIWCKNDCRARCPNSVVIIVTELFYLSQCIIQWQFFSLHNMRYNTPKLNTFY